MKKTFLNLLITFGVIAVFLRIVTLPYSQYTKFLYFSPCANPIHYRIGSIDKGFNISEDELSKYTEQAANIWEDAYGKDLFVQDPSGKLSVNMVFDERQSLNKQIANLQDQVKNQEGSLKPTLAEYEKKSAEFKAKLDDLNRQIEYWNSRGGAPKEEYDKIIEKQQQLKSEAQELNTMAASLNKSADQYNTSINTLNKTVSNFNAQLETRPEEGIYDPNQNRIEIYFHINKNELVHTLAHEFGHSLGLDHINNKNAIMFSSTNSQIAATPQDIDALKKICENRSYFDLYEQRLRFLLDQGRQYFLPPQSS